MTRTWQLAGFLLVLTVLQFGFPVTYYGTLWTALYVLPYGAMILLGMLIVRGEGQRLAPVIAIGIAFLAIAAWYMSDVRDPTATLWMFVVLGVFQLALLSYLGRFMFGPGGATRTELILAGVSVYLLLGSVFSVAYGVIESLAPGSFQDLAAADAPVTWQQLLYLSFVTITTLGYGDVLPVAPWARSLVTVEAVTGTLFLAIVIARLVGTYTSRPAPPGS